MFLKITTSTLLAAFLVSTAWADEAGPNSNKFYEDTAAYEYACENENACVSPYRNEVVYNHSRQINKLADSTKDALNEISFSQAQIWGDTILEGDYAADGNTRLDSVLAYFKGDRLIGYKIRYSEKAWYTGECDYDGQEESLVSCAKGRISEGSFVAADLQTFYTNENEQADFAFDMN